MKLKEVNSLRFDEEREKDRRASFLLSFLYLHLIIRFYSAFKPFSDRPLIEQQISPLLCLL